MIKALTVKRIKINDEYNCKNVIKKIVLITMMMTNCYVKVKL
jgi:hypothetical protein